jgi:hypothetical protein
MRPDTTTLVEGIVLLQGAHCSPLVTCSASRIQSLQDIKYLKRREKTILFKLLLYFNIKSII